MAVPQVQTSRTQAIRSAQNIASNSITEEDLMKHVKYLSGLGPHPAGSKADLQAVEYIERQFRSYNYHVKRQPIDKLPQGILTYNVIASSPVTRGKLRLVVGAHHDTTPTAPGADDNATGIAVLLETARALSRRKPAFDIVFVAFGAEELKHNGSKYFVRHARPLPHGMINLDMVAIGQVFQIGSYNTNAWLMKHCVSAAQDIGVEQLEPDAHFGGKSDYASFAAAGVPIAAYAWDPEDPYKHSPNDSLSHLRKRGLLTSFKRQMAITANALLAALLTPSKQAMSVDTSRSHAKSKNQVAP
jgi:Iap family predicted aminopeptidase